MKMVKLTNLLVVAGILMASQSPTSQAFVADIVAPEFFNSITNEADASCAGKNFYTRAAFLDALNSATLLPPTTPKARLLPLSPISLTKLDIFATYIEEINSASQDYCDETVTQ